MIKIIKKEDFKRVKTENSDVSNIVADILENVKRNGDKAVTFYERKFGNDL
ncbi:MAG: histidinol dehydrogenase, partial [Synergistaceae bacterium]|nr:histidinol dehydrogenase [Synergistaceae bacterium]